MTRSKSGRRMGPIVLVAVVAVFGVVVGIAPAASAATVCCYRWWGNTTATEQVGPGVMKYSPWVSEIDWAQVQIGSDFEQTQWIRIQRDGSPSLTASGRGQQWTRLDPAGTLVQPSGLRGACWWTWNISPAFPTSAMYCDMKYWP